jgi:hypothetical protein
MRWNGKVYEVHAVGTLNRRVLPRSRERPTKGDWSAPLIAESHSKRCTLEINRGSDTFEFEKIPL